MYTKRDLLNDLKGFTSNCLEIIKRKNEDYASGSPFSNFEILSVMVGRLLQTPQQLLQYRERIVEFGFISRLMDKIMRLCTLFIQKAQVTNESIDDTINDAINYLLLLKAYLKNKEVNNGKH